VRTTGRPHPAPARATVALGLFVACTLAACGSTRDTTRDTAQSVRVDGAPLSTWGGEGADEAVGAPAPFVAGTDPRRGVPVAIGRTGRATAVVFVAEWCGRCRDAIEVLARELAASDVPAGTDVVVVSTAAKPGGGTVLPAWLERNDWPTPVLADDGEGSVAEAFGLANYPYFVFVDANGKVVSRTSGEIPISEFRDRVNELAS